MGYFCKSSEESFKNHVGIRNLAMWEWDVCVNVIGQNFRLTYIDYLKEKKPKQVWGQPV